MDHRDDASILRGIRQLHSENRLCGQPHDRFLALREDLVLYVRSLLCDEVPAPADACPEEWGALIDALRCHWVVALLYKKARVLSVELQPPPDIMGRMKSYYVRGMKHAIESDKQIAEILRRFRQAGIPIMPVKGAALSRFAYPDPAVRYGSDLDFLVLPGDVRRSRDALEDLGYECKANFFDTLGEGYSEEWFIDKTLSGHRQPIEIHWTALHNIRSLPGPDIDEVFHRKVQVRTPWLTMETLDPADSLLQAAQHMMLSHRQDLRLIWIYDISLLARLVKTPDEWQALLERSVSWRARISLEKALKLAQLWTGFRAPFGFDDFSRWPAPLPDEMKIFDLMARGNGPVTKLRLILPAGTTNREKARFLWSLLFPPAAYMREVYPPSREWLLPLSYCRRLIKYTRK